MNHEVPPRGFNPVLPGLLNTEANLHRGYGWCLNAVPRIRETAAHLRGQLALLDETREAWQRTKVVINVFLLGCAISDSRDDYLAGKGHDFSKAVSFLSALARRSAP